ncbi:MAG: DEAD/DEAH box helicase [Candidatus Riflebacteria bacterium]|nr:DEAD/DEAH box helicase [Candidatus Riflebacteria bacterium]
MITKHSANETSSISSSGISTTDTSDELPTQVAATTEETGPVLPVYPDFRFDQLSERVTKAVATMGWTAPLAVQARVVPFLMDERDVIVQSRTGSGKTGAFVIPIVEKIDPKRRDVQALVLVPTRELAQQVHNEVVRLCNGDTGVSVAIYGGTGYKTQLDALKNGAAVVVATPGRLLDHLNRGTLSLKNIRTLILDEADELLSMGFFGDLLRVKVFLPRKRTSAMFSATMPSSVQRLAHEFLNEPFFLGLSGDSLSVPQMEHHYYTCEAMWKDRALMKIIEAENPTNGIIFCNTKDEVGYLTALLQRYGYDVEPISGDLGQKDRDRVMTKLRMNRLRFLVATDVAARGIDISHLEYVFIYDWHKDFEQYIHRAGRTGRAGKSGIAISLVSILEEADLKRAGRRHSIDFVSKTIPDDLTLQGMIAERFITRLEAERRDLDKPRMERLNRYAAILPALRDHEQGPQLLALLVDQYHQKMVKEALIPPPTADGSPAPDDEDSFTPRSTAPRREDREKRPFSRGRSGGNRSHSGPR